MQILHTLQEIVLLPLEILLQFCEILLTFSRKSA